MRRFSKREDYAVILVDSLALHFEKRLVALSEVAAEYKLSVLLLRNVAQDLRRAGLITAVEGRGGGYKLTRHPEKIQIGEIIRAFSTDPLYMCCQNTTDGKCSASACPHGFSLNRLNNMFLEKVANMTLAEFRESKNV